MSAEGRCTAAVQMPRDTSVAVTVAVAEVAAAVPAAAEAAAAAEAGSSEATDAWTELRRRCRKHGVLLESVVAPTLWRCFR